MSGYAQFSWLRKSDGHILSNWGDKSRLTRGKRTIHFPWFRAHQIAIHFGDKA
jgi:hypothetical protein